AALDRRGSRRSDGARDKCYEIYIVAMPDSLTATDPVLDRITRTIVERFHPERVLLFGSRARGDASAHSDYDIMVVMDADPNGGDPVKAIHAAFPNTTWGMDVVVRTPAEFERKRDDVGTLAYVAEREGRVLYARPGSGGPANSSGTAPRVREEQRGPPESLADWMHRAENDFRSVERLVSAPSPTWDAVCFHAHDGAEKYLKSALVATHTPPPRTHFLRDLLAICPTELRTDRVVVDACTMLGAIWPKTRYPEEPEPSAAEGAAAVRAARDVRGAVLAFLEWLR
ncbi:MAG TPA: HEPN domain-containing protein, partial [Gemmatimonadaceae bacterium]|nr:HEPN domain-containing protein [Gemmatimonadaceae bacterium]